VIFYISTISEQFLVGDMNACCRVTVKEPHSVYLWQLSCGL